ncbi:hypothetical protein HYZ98_01325 [Candidatus Peregrinibacteria bacterium]|nr:hypothetical protein [Candidatus Peregrinibacteria bacterium]
MERSSHDGGLSPQQKIAYAEYLFKNNGEHGRYEGTVEVAKDALEDIDRLSREERLRVFVLLMQCPQGRLTAVQKKYADRDTVAPADDVPAEKWMNEYLLRTYHGFPHEDTTGLLNDAEMVIKKEDISDRDRRFAHVLLCAYGGDGKQIEQSLDWLLEHGDEFSITEGFRRSVNRMNGRWRAQMKIDQALQKVRHPLLRARLLARRLEIYVKMFCEQTKAYDPKVNEQKGVIMEAIRDAFSTIKKTSGAIEPQVSSYFYMGLLYAEESKNESARTMFAKAIEIAEVYGLSGLADKARTEIHRVSQLE